MVSEPFNTSSSASSLPAPWTAADAQTQKTPFTSRKTRILALQWLAASLLLGAALQAPLALSLCLCLLLLKCLEAGRVPGFIHLCLEAGVLLWVAGQWSLWPLFIAVVALQKAVTDWQLRQEMILSHCENATLAQGLTQQRERYRGQFHAYPTEAALIHAIHQALERLPRNAITNLTVLVDDYSRFLKLSARFPALTVQWIPPAVLDFPARNTSGGTPLDLFSAFELAPHPLMYRGNRWLKRGLDVLGGLLGCVFLAGIYLPVAACIKASSAGPVFFVQKRLGRDEAEFPMLKFRSMRPAAPGEVIPFNSGAVDPRVTPIGKFLRKTSLDEFPQFLNVLRGEMSLVGPRPELRHYVDEICHQGIQRYAYRHLVKPGITGPSQISGLRGPCDIQQRALTDLSYIENWTLWGDCRLILQTGLRFLNDPKGG